MKQIQVKTHIKQLKKTWNIKNFNRYAKIHALFNGLAKIKKGLEERSWTCYLQSEKEKQFWKDFFGVKTLTELSDERLHELEYFLEKKLEFEAKKKKVQLVK